MVYRRYLLIFKQISHRMALQHLSSIPLTLLSSISKIHFVFKILGYITKLVLFHLLKHSNHSTFRHLGQFVHSAWTLMIPACSYI